MSQILAVIAEAEGELEQSRIRRTDSRVSAEDEITDGIADGLAVPNLNALKHMRMMADDDVCAVIQHGAGEILLIALMPFLVFHAAVHRADNHLTAVSPEGFDLLFEQRALYIYHCITFFDKLQALSVNKLQER